MKEFEVLRWMADGLSSKQIADKMRLSIHTINNHRKNMLAKTNATNAIDLINHAYRQRLL